MNNFAVIFDMDGVLIDSVGINWKAYNQILAQYGCRVSNDKIHQYMGLTLDDQVKRLNKEFNLNIDVAAFEKESSKIKEVALRVIRPKKGVMTLLQSLREEGSSIAVGTSSPLSITRNNLTRAGIWQYFDVYVTKNDVSKHKPHPEVYTTAAEALGITPDYCVVIEDAPAGIQAAKDAAMRCVAVKTPYVPHTTLSRADVIVSSLNELSPISLRSLVGL